MTKIVSEIGWNHMGDITLAKEMISASKENGADFVKFQTWSVERLKNGPWDEDGRLEIYKKAELTKDQHVELYEYSNKVGIEFFSSAFSIEDAKLLSEVQNKYVKIASFDSDNIDLLKFCNDNFETMFISTGTKTVDEVKSSVSRENIPDAKIIVLHCISSYPLEPKNANLPRINSFKKIYDKVGYSDHTFGVETTKVALEYDIDIVEKHFTLDRDLPGRDNKFAILPHELKDLSDYIKLREESKTFHGDGYLECEQEARDVMTGRFDG
jgi:sialic acid synthase SpsE|tara:strand:- start:973 stop:1779 length:807 start_codon:yes stop_codon:yes gene_type:complete